jgi:ribosomal protein L10
MSNFSKKEPIIKDIQNNFQQAQAIIFYNFCQVENKEIFKLKKELKKVGSYWKVYKNKLVEKAVPQYPLKLSQNNAFIFCQADEYKPLNILTRFNQEYSTIKRFHGGIYQQNLVSGTVLEEWGNLPSQETLLNTLCYYLNFNIRRLINILEKIK